MNILVTNDDGINAKGLKVLAEVLRPLGKLTVIAPKYHQSGMSMACTMGLKPIAVKTVSSTENETWISVDGTPATCVKWGLDKVFTQFPPDLVVSGINHGGNYASAVLYSGTVGAIMEGVLADVPSIAVSLDDVKADPDFSAVRKYLPEVLKNIIENYNHKRGVLYNVNFPKTLDIKGIRAARQGRCRWFREFEPYDFSLFEKRGTTPEAMGVTFPPVEEGEEVYVMLGHPRYDRDNTPDCDNNLIDQGYITVTVQNIDYTDNEALEQSGFLNKDFE